MKEPYNRFIWTIKTKAPQTVKREWRRKEKGGKRPFKSMIDEVAFFDFKDVGTPLKSGFGPLSAFSVVRGKHVTCLGPRWKSTPAVATEKTSTMPLSLSLGQHVNGHFPPFSIFPPFSFLFWHSFLLVAAPCFKEWPSGPQQKKLGFFFPPSFCEEVRAGNIYS